MEDEPLFRLDESMAQEQAPQGNMLKLNETINFSFFDNGQSNKHSQHNGK